MSNFTCKFSFEEKKLNDINKILKFVAWLFDCLCVGKNFSELWYISYMFPKKIDYSSN